jgi:hypothetical protein
MELAGGREAELKGRIPYLLLLDLSQHQSNWKLKEGRGGYCWSGPCYSGVVGGSGNVRNYVGPAGELLPCSVWRFQVRAMPSDMEASCSARTLGLEASA